MPSKTSYSSLLTEKMKKYNIIIGKFFAIGSKPTEATFPELPDCVLWLRFCLAILYGLYLGPKAGAVNALFGMNIVTFVPIMYCQLLLVADMDSYEEVSLHFVGVAQAIGLVLLVWIYGFTQLHAPEEAKLVAAMIVQQVVQQQQAGGDPEEFDAAASATAEGVAEQAAAASESAIPVEPESEF